MTYSAVIRTQADLERMWRDLMGPLGFSGYSLWLIVLEPDGSTTPVITEITECSPFPDEGPSRAGLVDVLRMLVTEAVPGGRVAFLRTRPGRDGINESDRAWAAMLYAAAREAGGTVEVVHVANSVMLAPLPLDALRMAG
ncbi:hypothetical protein [Nocardioides sp. cx-173]|uniref:hypothetical protein n=1 Tax=Nocardioides sp. cx-173 TaxID=2898796 RepID=UPI001E6389B7|nr:hypothetical protein [Nocardioides sp. cx-173]MCD4526754.1 hypothetical protein [Nocardioides sp. cx-173]UGB42504.1 hypothetical protein LQ940_03025 [Nocardioides sp. cx-173]